MSKRQFLCLLGVWVMVFHFLGFPASWDNIISVLTGILIAGVAYTLPGPVQSSPKETFIENKQP